MPDDVAVSPAVKAAPEPPDAISNNTNIIITVILISALVLMSLFASAGWVGWVWVLPVFIIVLGFSVSNNFDKFNAFFGGKKVFQGRLTEGEAWKKLDEFCINEGLVFERYGDKGKALISNSCFGGLKGNESYRSLFIYRLGYERAGYPLCVMLSRNTRMICIEKNFDWNSRSHVIESLKNELAETPKEHAVVKRKGFTSGGDEVSWEERIMVDDLVGDVEE